MSAWSPEYPYGFHNPRRTRLFSLFETTSQRFNEQPPKDRYGIPRKRMRVSLKTFKEKGGEWSNEAVRDKFVFGTDCVKLFGEREALR